MARCAFLLRQEIQNFSENRAAENQAKGLETYGPDFTPNAQAVRNGPGGNPERPRKSWRLCRTPTISRAAGRCQQSPLAPTGMQKSSGSFLGSLGYGGRWSPCRSLRGRHRPTLSRLHPGACGCTRNGCLGTLLHLSRGYNVTLVGGRGRVETGLRVLGSLPNPPPCTPSARLCENKERKLGLWGASGLERTYFIKTRSPCQQIK